jgi:carbon-monoxide dehydrogenase large subunit
MADGATYRAVFLRMHPTGKAVLSLSEASQGEEATLAGIAAGELGIPPEDIKVVHQDTGRFGEGNTFNSEPSDAVGENVAITARKLRDKAQIVAGSMLGASPDSLTFDNGHWTAGGGSGGVRIQEVALHTFGGFELPEGIEGSLDAQTTYRIGAVQAAG